MATSAIHYPYRVFRFVVEIGDIERASFSEVSGMNSSVDVVEYREGDDLRNTPRKMTGLTKFGNVTLRWGVCEDADFLDWVYSCAPTNEANPTGMTRKDMTITLYDDKGDAGPSWELINCWPVGYTVPDFNGMGSEVAIHSLELCHEGLHHTPGNKSNDESPA